MGDELLPVLPSRGDPVTEDDLRRIEHEIAHALATIDDVDTLNEWRLRARALEEYLRSKGLHGPMLGAQRRMEGRLGQLLGPPKPGKSQPRNRAYEVVRHEPERHDFRLLAAALDGGKEIEGVWHPVTLPSEESWRQTRRTLVGAIRAQLPSHDPDLPEGTYRCIVADPPWKVASGPEGFGAAVPTIAEPTAYRSMTVAAIAELAVAELADDDAHLYLWTINAYVTDAYDIARAWGFEPSTLLVWCKAPHGLGLGGAYTLTTEYVLFARRGSLTPFRRVDSSWFGWPRGRHSAKPAGFYELVQSVSPGPYLDLFAREPREGWVVWGDEVAA